MAVGVGAATLVAAETFYSLSHGHTILELSRFTFRVATSTLLVGYFVARETRKVNATYLQAVMCVLAAGLFQLAISFGFRQTVGQVGGILYASGAAIEIFFIVELMTRFVMYFRRKAEH